MLYIEIIYILTALIALSACVPQVKQLLKSKRSDEFSLQTWLTWTCTQLATFAYVVMIGDVLMACVNVVWVSFYAYMTFLIVRYRRHMVRTAAIEVVE